MTARELTISRAIELFSVFKYECFTMRRLEKEMPSFTEYDIKHIRMFNCLDSVGCPGSGHMNYKFNKDPKTMPL